MFSFRDGRGRSVARKITDTMLRAQGIVMRYGPRTAVDNVDLAVEPGEILGLLGPNGAG
ncbi:MAG: ABC transporter ATP-binding protein, partial [Actinomycetota bacterium]|nr:ABC transporter ATP-binding protein [Actinomycetota bacterium]